MIKKAKKWALSVLLTLFCVCGFAQTIPITGTITDQTGETMPGVNIQVKGSITGTVTDMDGRYSIEAPSSESVLVFTFVGYKPVEITVGDRREIPVMLEEDTQEIDEVVVIGYGSVKKSTLTNAVSKMDASALEDRAMARVENALQGQLAGVMVRSVSGEPGQDILIRVRGAASVNASADPLYVVDGMPINTLSGVNPGDIQSIEVLKDAASSAIYGSRGSNGVVLVTTKKGRKGKPRVSLNASYGIQTMEKKLDMLNSEEWMEFRTKANDSKYLSQAVANKVTDASIADDNETRRKNIGKTAFDPYVELDPRWFKYLGNDMRASHPWHTQQGDADPADLELLDWQEEFYKPAGVTDVSLNVAGGSDNTNYMFSGGVFSQDGLAHNTNFNRYSFRMNVESQINKYITTGMQFAPSYITRDGSGRANGKDSRAHYALISLPVAEPGTGYYFNSRGNPPYAWQFANSANKSSPLAYMDNIRHDDMLRLNGNAFVRITPLDGLKVEFSGSANFFNLDGQTYTFSENGADWAKGEGVNSSGGHNTRREWRTLLQALANYDKTFGKHSVSAMLGASQEQTDIGYSTAQDFKAPFPNDNMNYAFDESTLAVSNSNVAPLTPSRLVSFFGRLQYSYDERYMFSGSLRYDGGSVFGANNKWGVFPAFSAGWNISREQFFSNLNLTWLNTLKFRASYGATGNNSIRNDAAYETLVSSVYAGLSGYYVSANPAAYSNLGWEKTNSTDVAIDVGILQNRVQFSIDWYTKTTSDLLYQVPAVGASGSPTIWGNAGEIFNTGFEIELNTANFTGDFKWNTSFNMSYNVNEVRKLGETNTPVFNDYNGVIGVRKVGEPLNVFFLPKNIGVWKNQQEIDAYKASIGVAELKNGTVPVAPGDPRYEDTDRNGVIDYGTGETSDRQIVGNPMPKFTFGMTNRFAWKNFDLSVLITAQTGGEILGQFGRQCDRPGMDVGDNMMGRWRNAWWSEAEPGDGETPSVFSTAQGGNSDTRWLYSSDYLRIKNVTLGYKIPVNPKFVSYLRAYVSVENLIKWDSYYGGFSPEAANGSNNTWGVDYASYPMARIVTFGVNVNF